MDKLQWFKFTPSDWMMGKIMRCPEVTQARFLRLCCLYWNKETNLTEEDARIEIDDEHFDLLLKKKIVSSDDENIFIDFLDEQFDKILETSKQASKAGKASAAKRKALAEQKVNDRSTTVQQIPTDKIREDKKREEESIGEFHTHESFLIWFKECRKYINLEYKVQKLNAYDKQLFNELKDYTKEDFKKAFKNFSSDKYYLDNNLIFPKHFLKEDNFIKYLNQPITKELTFAEKLRGKIA